MLPAGGSEHEVKNGPLVVLSFVDLHRAGRSSPTQRVAAVDCSRRPPARGRVRRWCDRREKPQQRSTERTTVRPLDPVGDPCSSVLSRSGVSLSVSSPCPTSSGRGSTATAASGTSPEVPGLTRLSHSGAAPSTESTHQPPRRFAASAGGHRSANATPVLPDRSHSATLHSSARTASDCTVRRQSLSSVSSTYRQWTPNNPQTPVRFTSGCAVRTATLGTSSEDRGTNGVESRSSAETAARLAGSVCNPASRSLSPANGGQRPTVQQ